MGHFENQECEEDELAARRQETTSEEHGSRVNWVGRATHTSAYEHNFR